MEEISNDIKKPEEATFKLNYVTAILLLVVAILMGYIIYFNLERVKENAPVSNNNQNSPSSEPAGNSPNKLTPAEAQILALRAVADKPGFHTYFELALADYAVDSDYAAIRAWGKALEYEPTSAAAYSDIGVTYGKLGKYDDEIAACRKALAIDPNYSLAQNNINWAMDKKNGK